MRFYTFCNFYLSSIQQGIQSAHCLHELFVQPCRTGDVLARTMLWDWAQHHKTIIVLNGGTSADLNEMTISLGKIARGANIPFASWAEDGPSLNNAATCVGMIVPAKIYEAAALLRSPETKVLRDGEEYHVFSLSTARVTGEYMLTFAEYMIAQTISKHGLAH